MFRQRLNSEFSARKQANPRYSLRAFAAFLGIDHSTLSQILKGRRRPTAAQIRGAGRKLGMPAEEVAVYLAAEHVSETSTAERQNQLRHWTAEAMAVVSQRIHWDILRLSRAPGFRADCGWIAGKSGVSVDEVNLALTRLLRLGLLNGNWKDATGAQALTEAAFRRLALSRVRQMA